METMIRFLLIGSVLVLQDFSFASNSEDEPKLALLHILNAHGDLTPAPLTYPNDPYLNKTYYPAGRSALSDNGKWRAYNLGRWLRDRYDDFLGPVYTPEVIETRCADVDFVKMTTQLVQAGLYPPAPIQQWNDDLDWQPIPYIYRPTPQDIYFTPHLCSKSYIAESRRVRNSTEVQKIIARYAKKIKQIEELTGLTIKSTADVLALFFAFKAEIAADIPQPKWLPDIHDAITDLAILEVELISYNTALKRQFGGELVRKFVDDTRSYEAGTLLKGRKLFHYSAHTTTIVALQRTLGVFKPHMPLYGTMEIIEIWELNGKLFVKIIYFTGDSDTIVTQKLPGCDELCPFEKFVKILAPVTATDEDMKSCVPITGC